MSKFWWDNLTPFQQWFIMSRYGGVWEDKYIHNAYQNKHAWHEMIDWPNE